MSHVEVTVAVTVDDRYHEFHDEAEVPDGVGFAKAGGLVAAQRLVAGAWCTQQQFGARNEIRSAA